MTQHLIDRTILLKQCTRCNAYVFVGMDGGTQAATDTKPLTVEEYRQAIIEGRNTFDVVTQAGRPYLLRMRGPYSQWPPYAGRAVVAEHPCTRSINMSGVELIDPPALTRASDTSEHGANKASAMESLGTTDLSGLVPNAILRHSECDSCGKPVRLDQLHMGIEHNGRFEWIQHMECE